MGNDRVTANAIGRRLHGDAKGNGKGKSNKRKGTLFSFTTSADTLAMVAFRHYNRRNSCTASTDKNGRGKLMRPTFSPAALALVLWVTTAKAEQMPCFVTFFNALFAVVTARR